MSAPALAPLFRSGEQLRILARLFAGPDGELSIGQLADESDVAVATASREVARLAEHGLVHTRQVGRTRLVQANWSLPWAPELRSILVQTVGVLGLLGEHLRAVEGIDAAYVYGSWAERYRGVPGPFPRDADLLVVGDPDRRALNAALRRVEKDLRIGVNPVVANPQEWGSPPRTSFLAQVKAGALVPVPFARSS